MPTKELTGVTGADEPSSAGRTGHLVVIGASLVVIAQLAFRCWALYPSWFFYDDYSLLIDAQQQPLSLGYFLEPFNGRPMIGGRFVAAVVSELGVLNWGAAATIAVVLQFLASAACVWMLITLFGVRPGILVPLCLYATSTIALPAAMWWTSAINQVPVQIAFFVAIGAWCRYLRKRRVRHLLATTLAMIFGLAFREKAILILPVLAFLSLAYFASGSIFRRLNHVAVFYAPAWLVGGALAVLYLVFYVQQAEAASPSGFSLGQFGVLAESMIGTGVATAVVGGPWAWSEVPRPTAYADPPLWAQHLAFTFAVLVVLYGWLRRSDTLRSWALLTLYLVGQVLLLAQVRVDSFGLEIGLEYRFIAEVSVIVVLCLGLAFMELSRSVESSLPRDSPLLLWQPSGWTVTALVVAICASSAVSSVRYVNIWHAENASHRFMVNLMKDADRYGYVDLADRSLPDAVMSGLTAPNNRAQALASLVSADLDFPVSASRLGTVADDGTIRQAVIQPGVTSRPGPRADCGWLVGSSGREIPLMAQAFEWTWWIRVGYLAARDSAVNISAGDTVVTSTVDAGAHELFLKVDGSFDSVSIDGLGVGATMCVDKLVVGQAVPGGVLP